MPIFRTTELPEPLAPALPPMSPILRTRLATIESWILLEDNESEALWNVLCALRGPDEVNKQDKAYTTCVIRTTAFPRLAAAAEKGGGLGRVAAFAPRNTALAPYVPARGFGLAHFLNHVRLAARALGLMPRP